MDGLDDFALALAIGLPIVLVAAAACYVSLSSDRPQSDARDCGLTAAVAAPDDESEATIGGPNR
jgi:hypothetical protein